MSFYENYLLKYMAADELTRKKAKKHWFNAYKENLAAGLNIDHDKNMIVTIALADDFLSDHITND